MYFKLSLINYLKIHFQIFLNLLQFEANFKLSQVFNNFIINFQS